MQVSAEILTIIALTVLAAISYGKWKSIGKHWPKLRRHGGNIDTFKNIEIIAMGLFYVSFYNVLFMLTNLFLQIPYAYITDIVINTFIFMILFLLDRKTIKSHENRGRNPEVVQVIIGTFYLGFIGAEFWIKHNAPQLLVKIINGIV